MGVSALKQVLQPYVNQGAQPSPRHPNSKTDLSSLPVSLWVAWSPELLNPLLREHVGIAQVTSTLLNMSALLKKHGRLNGLIWHKASLAQNPKLETAVPKPRSAHGSTRGSERPCTLKLGLGVGEHF